MTGVSQIFRFQEIDSEIGAVKARLAQIEQQLQENAELRGARSELERREDLLRTLEDNQKSLERDVESTRTRIGALEARMYGDQAGNPRELQSIVTEIGHLKERQKELEDGVLSIMEESDAARLDVEGQRAIVEELEAQWGSDQSHLLEEKARLQAELPQWEEKRLQHAGILPEPSMRIYERLRTAKGGVAVARVERGMCTGCRITLPIILVQQARSHKQFTYCSSCGRLLFVS